MQIGVVSDSHSDAQGVQQATGILKRLGVSLVIHCGDVGPEIVPFMEGLPVHFVCGNMDNPDELREAIIAPEHKFYGRLGRLEIEGRRVAFLHGHDMKLLRETVHSGGWDLVCHGHTHVFSKGVEGRTLVLNPGALSRSSHPSLAVVEMPSLEVTEVPLW